MYVNLLAQTGEFTFLDTRHGSRAIKSAIDQKNQKQNNRVFLDIKQWSFKDIFFLNHYFPITQLRVKDLAFVPNRCSCTKTKHKIVARKLRSKERARPATWNPGVRTSGGMIVGGDVGKTKEAEAGALCGVFGLIFKSSFQYLMAIINQNRYTWKKIFFKMYKINFT